MNSFYLALNSEGNKNIHHNNHGGDFKIELNNTLDLPGRWEMALIEMTYFGQYFSNVMEEYGSVTISSNKNAVYPTKFIVNYEHAKELYINIYIKFGIPPDYWFHQDTLRLGEKRHYTWKSLKKALQNLKHESFSLLIKDHKLYVTPLISSGVFKVEFSTLLVKVLTLESSSISYEDNTYPIYALSIKKPADIIDDSIVLFTPDTEGDIWIRIDNTKIIIPNMYCTVNQFNELAYNSFLKFTIEIVDGEWELKCLYTGIEDSYNAMLTFSQAMQSALTVPMFSNIFCGVSAMTSFMIQPRKAIERDNSFNQITFKLTNNYYPSPKSLVENLNELVVENMYKIAEMQHSEQDFEKIFIYHDVGHLASFMAVNQFEVKLSNFMLKMLNLKATLTSCVGMAAVDLPSAIRPFLHVYCNAIIPHIVNDDEYPLLRVINNSAIENEKVMLSFNQPQYYPVARRYISSIHTSITDHISTDPLHFIHTVSYLLHFRPCHFT